MKNYIAILILFLTAWSLSAESVWTGNAAVGGSVDFPDTSEIFQAASNTFPSGTMLRVTNPRGGSSVDVKVTGRLESPGVFILIEERAASSIGLPRDLVMPVRVSPLKSESEPDMSPGLMETETPATEETALPAAVKPAAGEPQTIVTYDLSGGAGTAGETAAAKSVVSNTEAGPVANEDFGVESGSGKIFFLMPADLRPPESPAVSSTTVEEAAPLPPESEDASFSISEVLPGDKGYYVQIGAYRNRSVMEDAARWISIYAPGYPVSMAIADTSSGKIYKLLLGPLKPAERGVVLRSAKTAFFGAFPYRP
jgi:cell division septation protein DedD